MATLLKIAALGWLLVFGWAESDLDFELYETPAAGPTDAKMAPSPDLTAYAQCVADMKTSLIRYESYVPILLMAVDRKLVRMAEGIGALESNYALLQQQYALGPNDPLKHHLLSNGVEGCRAFQGRFEARMKRLALIVFSVSGFFVALFLRLALGFFTSGRPAPQKMARPNEPQDQPRQAKK
jgi:hypothetical protein